MDGVWQSHVNECADVEIDMKEIVTCGSDWTGHKCEAKKRNWKYKRISCNK